jgi:hypothetical protein
MSKPIRLTLLADDTRAIVDALRTLQRDTLSTAANAETMRTAAPELIERLRLSAGRLYDLAESIAGKLEAGAC